jgi:hypothetical protein
MPRLKTKSQVTYATKVMKPGDEFDASDYDASMLIGFGIAELVKVKEEPPPPPPQPEPEGSEPEPSTEPRRYRRRDMKAES